MVLQKGKTKRKLTKVAATSKTKPKNHKNELVHIFFYTVWRDQFDHHHHDRSGDHHYSNG